MQTTPKEKGKSAQRRSVSCIVASAFQFNVSLNGPFYLFCVLSAYFRSTYSFYLVCVLSAVGYCVSVYEVCLEYGLILMGAREHAAFSEESKGATIPLSEPKKFVCKIRTSKKTVDDPKRLPVLFTVKLKPV